MLHNLYVLELASVLAGPSVGQFFAELGATVIKIENPSGGDVTRTWKSAGEKTDDRSAYFCSVNWGKKSVTADLSTPEGQKLVHRLAARADIVIASYKPGDAEKLGVAYNNLRIINPRLIYGQITGYGAGNDRVGYDAVIQAESGFMALNGESNGPPVKMPVALIDLLAGHQLKEGLLLALLQRERSGEGTLVQVSLIQAALASLANQATNWLVAQQMPKRQGSAHPNIAPYGEAFETQDGKHVLLSIGSDRQFADLLTVLQLVPSKQFATNPQRVQHRAALNVMLSEAIKCWSSHEFLTQLHLKKIPAGIIQTVPEALAMPEAEPIRMHNNALHGVRSFVALLGTQPFNTHTLLPPPHIGEHTQEVMRELGG